MAEQIQQNQENPTHSLTPREKEVLGCLARGAGDKEIAHALHIEESTVRFHLKRLFDKTGTSKRGKLQAWAWKNGYGEK